MPKAKYLKNKDGEIFSPIVSSSSVYLENGTQIDSKFTEFTTRTDPIGTTKKISKTLQLTTSWQDTGIVTTNIFEGLAVFKVFLNYHGGGWWGETYVGVTYCWTGNCNSSNADEIAMNCAGHARNGHWIKLRWCRVSSGNTQPAKLQIIADTNWSASYNIDFYFKKLM